MVITFPNMGNVATAAAAFFQGMHIPYIMPEQNNKKTLQLGSFHSPEEICLPFKLVLGNFIECIERGADTVILPGSCGPCRFGEYCEMLMKILRKLGYGGVEFIVVDFSSEIGREELKRRIGTLSEASPLSPLEQAKALRTAYRVVELCDRVDAKAYDLAGREANRGECKRILSKCRAEVSHCENPAETIRLLRSYLKKLDGVQTDPRKTPLEIAVIGEIFTVIDPFSNLYIEEKLMDYGVSSRRMLTPSWWVKDLMLKPLRLNSRAVNTASRRYLPYGVGGHGKECIGEAVLAQKHGIDGAIQIFPLGCMPEVVAKSILPAIQRDTGLPIMTLIVDEVTGEAGYVTRIEAFLDMLQSRKKQGAGRENLPHAAAAGPSPGRPDGV